MKHPLREAAPHQRSMAIWIALGATDLVMSGALIWSFAVQGFSLAYLIGVLAAGVGLAVGFLAALQRVGALPELEDAGEDDKAAPDPKVLLKRERFAATSAMLSGAFLLAIAHAIPLAGISGLAALLALPVMRMVVGVAPLAAEQEELSSASGYQPDPFLENAGGLLAAVLVIMLSYAFALEAFRIPTGSMEPTLYGDPVMGDRTIVNKLSRSFGDPQRGDIIVMRFPLGRAQPYVKRVAGLPGETVLVAQGDVYLKGAGDEHFRIWRKRDAIRETMWLNVLDQVGGPITFKRDFGGLSGKASADQGGFTLSPEGETPARLRYPAKEGVRDHNQMSQPDAESNGAYESEHVHDLRARFTWAPEAKSTLSLRIARGDKSSLEVRLKQGEAPHVLLLQPGMERAKALEVKGPKLPASGAQSVLFGVADGGVELVVDGRRYAIKPFESILEQKLRKLAEAGNPLDPTTTEGMRRLVQLLPRRQDTHLEWRVEGAASSFRDLHIDRDIHYLGRVRTIEHEVADGVYELRRANAPTLPWAAHTGEEEYIALGDNSPASEDSRYWIELAIATSEGEVFKAQHHAIFRSSARAAQAGGGMAMEILQVLSGLKPVAEDAPMLDALYADRAEYEAAVDVVEARLLELIRSTEMGQRLEFSDIYSIPRSLNIATIKSVELRLTPGVPAKLIDGQVLGSVFPEPRYVD